LPLALDPEHMIPVLAERSRAPMGPDFRIATLDVSVYRRHGNRCVVRYHARGRPLDGEPPPEWRLIGKVLPPGGREPIPARMCALWQHGFAPSPDGIGIPEPLAYVEELCLLLQEDVGGVSVRNLVKRAPDERHFRTAARALAKLHRCPLPAGRARGVNELL